MKSIQAGILIADTYSEFNLPESSSEQRDVMLGPFLYARSQEPAHRKAIADILRAPAVLSIHSFEGAGLPSQPMKKVLEGK